VSAREKTSATQAQITVTGNVKLSEKDIKRMSEDAEKYAEEDAAAKKRAMAHHKLETDVMDKQYELTGDEKMSTEMTEEDKAGIRAEVATTREWLSKNGPDTDVDLIDEEWTRFRDAVAVFREKYVAPAPAAVGDAANSDDDDDTEAGEEDASNFENVKPSDASDLAESVDEILADMEKDEV